MRVKRSLSSSDMVAGSCYRCRLLPMSSRVVMKE
jgi:hypothetical protein